MSIPELEARHKELLDSIINTQNTQKYLYNRLEVLTNSPDINKDEKDIILNHINELQDTQNNLYKQLETLYKKYSNLLGITKTDIDYETILIKVADDEIKQLQYNLKTLENRKLNHDRMVKINTYEQKLYMSRIKLSKMIIYVLLATFVISLLQRLFLPPLLAKVLYIILFLLSFVFIGRFLYDNMRRDDFDYDKYKWDHPTHKSDFDQNMIDNISNTKKKENDYLKKCEAD